MYENPRGSHGPPADAHICSMYENPGGLQPILAPHCHRLCMEMTVKSNSKPLGQGYIDVTRKSYQKHIVKC